METLFLSLRVSVIGNHTHIRLWSAVAPLDSLFSDVQKASSGELVFTKDEASLYLETLRFSAENGAIKLLIVSDDQEAPIYSSEPKEFPDAIGPDLTESFNRPIRLSWPEE